MGHGCSKPELVVASRRLDSLLHAARWPESLCCMSKVPSVAAANKMLSRFMLLATIAVSRGVSVSNLACVNLQH